MKKKHLLFALFCSGLLSCTTPTATQQLAGDILADQSFHTVDSMARAVIRSGFNAGSGYSQIWARDMNTFIEVACEESNPSDPAVFCPATAKRRDDRRICPENRLQLG